MRAIVQRHGKLIMTILGITLMFIFALPTFRAPSTNRADMLAGKLNGHKVSQDDMDVCKDELAAFEMLHLYEYSQGYGLVGYVMSAMVTDETERPIYWYLLCQEASHYGMAYVSDAEARQKLTDMGLSDANIDKGLRTAGLNPRDLGPMVSKLEVASSYLQFLASQPRSVASMELSADRELSKLQVAYALLDANRDWDKAAAPTDDQIKKQFDLYKNVIRTPIPPAPIAATTAPADQEIVGTPPLPELIDGHHYPFGYKYPDRVAVDYLVFNRAAIRAGMKLTQEDIDNADKYYFSHQEEFRNITPPPPATAPASQPATAPAIEAATKPAIKPLKEVQDSLRDKQIDARVNAVMKKMTDRVLAQAAEPWKTMTIDDKGYRETLGRGSWADYQKLAEDVSKNREFGGYKPEFKSTGTKLLDANGLSKLEGIGAASYHVPNQSQDFIFADLATHVRELVELKARNPLGRLFLQRGVEVQLPLQDKDGNLYVFRVTEADKTHEPKTPAEIDEVRPQVVEDLKKLATYQKLQTTGKELAATANRADLATIAQQKGLPEKTTPAFSRLDQSEAPDVAGIRGFVDAAFNLNSTAATQPEGATTKSTAIIQGPATSLDTEESLRVFVLQVVNQTPATGADFGGHRGALFREGDPAVGTLLRNYISLDTLAARLKYAPTVAFSKPKTDE